MNELAALTTTRLSFCFAPSVCAGVRAAEPSIHLPDLWIINSSAHYEEGQQDGRVPSVHHVALMQCQEVKDEPGQGFKSELEGNLKEFYILKLTFGFKDLEHRHRAATSSVWIQQDSNEIQNSTNSHRNCQTSDQSFYLSEERSIRSCDASDRALLSFFCSCKCAINTSRMKNNNNNDLMTADVQHLLPRLKRFLFCFSCEFFSLGFVLTDENVNVTAA